MSAPTVIPKPVPSPPPARASIACGHCHGRHAAVAQVRLCSRSDSRARARYDAKHS